ncbi:phosphate ABC transporter permease PstA [Nocardioides jishulii]|uniref:Phosphate transport system permease protein PstA n=1 Tax=Nocardioides jishulii TaxID=2575440 RepID=A0A4U2YT01_9ACTN|nr:phosphate ABC transporter permease PstA [Nocardioides jishulii]QCX26442.1 phosphate ABC transporter permease PstA [Nocardioides jishulii]TKI63752.1 phosphate ABC transporter permease PstA [Nocardioides jishulii]
MSTPTRSTSRSAPDLSAGATPPVSGDGGVEATPGEPARALNTLVRPQLPRWAPLLVALGAVALGTLVAVVLGRGPVAAALVAAVTFHVVMPVWSNVVEGGRRAKDRVATHVMWTAFVLAMLPLVTLLWQVISNGLPALSAEFFTYSMRNVVGEGGGIYHAIMGTLIVTAWATLISVPIGVLAAIYLVEYGQGSRLARWITFLVDVMTGIPSIVAGLFAYALFVLIFGPGVRMGFGGAVALAVLMVPVVVRSTEEMLKLVPNELREASYALGVPKWRTITKVVLPTAMAGIITGVTLAIARVAGETAPLLIIAGDTDSLNLNAFSERMATLPVFIYYSYMQPGVPAHFGQERAWGAALVLIAIVMGLNLLARAVGKYFAPKTGR